VPRKYYQEEKLPYMPSEQDIDQFIADMNKEYAPMLQLLKESGWRPGEAERLVPEDFDLTPQTVILNKPEKRSRPRRIRLRAREIRQQILLKWLPHVMMNMEQQLNMMVSQI
jgi:integrase